MGDAGTDGGGWSGFGEAEWRRLVDAFRAAAAGQPPEGLAALTEAYRQFAAQFAGALGAARAADAQGHEQFAAALQTLTRRFLESLAPVSPPPPAAPPAWVEAFLTWSTILGDLTRATATAFAARLARPDAPTTLRGLFDAWIDCAESTYQVEAHSERYARVQATLFNEAVALRARQQALLEQASRAFGLPGRREVDALHDALRELRAELDAERSRPKATAAAAPRRTPPPKAKGKVKAKPKPKPKAKAKPGPATRTVKAAASRRRPPPARAR